MTTDLSEMDNDRCFFADDHDGVSCSSKLTWMALSEFKYKKSERKCFVEAETILEVMLLKHDLFLQHKFNANTAFVCDVHRSLLLQHFYFQKGKSKCDTCLYVRKMLSDA